MLSLSLISLALLPYALAAPGPAPHAGSIHVPIVRRSISPQERVARLPQVMDFIRLKYGFKPVNQKRDTTSTAITDEENDSSYSAVVSIGTPAQNFNLILDTGSSDLWVGTNGCDCGSDVPLFNPSKSSSFKNGSAPLEITYGSGAVDGYVAADTVTFSGFTISGQVLLAVTETTADLLDDGLSGIMGLGFQTISALETSPFWETLFNQSKLSSPVFSFYLERYVNDPEEISTAPGGTFTLGGTNSSLYTGNIDFIDMPSGSTPSYWLQQVSTITVQGNTISVSSSEGLAAIDTGTTLIGAPSDVTKSVWSNVPGSVALTGEYAGMYSFPCSTSVSVSLSFGGNDWSISPEDMNLGAISGTGSNQMCVGGVFDVGSTVGSGEGIPSWIVGDTFLKNVYSVFQANPPAVGFAQLASGLSSSNSSSGGSSSSPTFSGSAGAPLPSGSSSPSGLGSSGASPRTALSMSLCLAMSLSVALFTLF